MNLSKDTLFSIDVETTGLIAGYHSVISLGVAAWKDGKEIGTFYACMKEWNGSTRDESTMMWWKDKHKDEWMAIRKLQEEPKDVMMRFYEWCKSFEGPRVLTANPAGFDCSMLWWYLHTFCGKDSITELFKRHRALDIRTFMCAVFDVPYSEAERDMLPAHWAEKQYITHNALDDARQQGTVLYHLMKVNSGDEQ